ncbi:MAG: excinuclease ABC subunit UvrA [bacterium]|nr:excinuclease ABC subunit UvrA [bacterium]
MLNKIIIRGARVHNLQNVDLDILHNTLVVFTGLSGSGKSSLAFDTIYAEGQRRFMESLSSFTKQFMDHLDKPDVDQIDGLPPTIAIDQHTSVASPRSTVGTATEMYDYLRLLFARIGTPHCPDCRRPILRYSMQEIVERVIEIMKTKPTETLFLAPLPKQDKIHLNKLIDELERLGYQHVRVDKLSYSLRELADARINGDHTHNIEIVVDKIEKGELEYVDSQRVVRAIKNAMELGDGTITILLSDEKKEHTFTRNLTCPDCSITIDELEPSHFSFNSPQGACSACTGLGYLLKFDPELLIPNKKLTIAQGAIQPLTKIFANNTHLTESIADAGKRHDFSLDTALQDFTDKQLKILFDGEGSRKKRKEGDFGGIIAYLEERYRDTDSEYLQKELEDYMRIFPCVDCEGRRLKPEALAVTVAGYSIDQIVRLSLGQLIDLFRGLDGDKNETSFEPLDEQQMPIAKPIIKEMLKRASSLGNVGLGYLILDRSMTTLSGGEAQRIKLANHISSSLVGVVYVLDEPSIGLHPKDTEQLIETLRTLRDAGNTVIVVEHDTHIIKSAEYVVDVGPGAGKNGGRIIAATTPQELMKNKHSLTGQYLSGVKMITAPKQHHKGTGNFIQIRGASEFNLKNIDVSIPLGKLVCVTGLSGSGKSTLVIEILSKALRKKFYRAKDDAGAHQEILGLEHIDKIIDIDQSAIGRTPRSNPATYTNIFTPIRELFTELPEARIKGFKPGHFSFNVKGGRCETCQGEGSVRIDMRFLSDVYVECRDCHGQRYNRDALEVHFEGQSIADVLKMTVDEAMEFFAKQTAIHDKLKTLSEVGLGYVQLGQPANTLSGGEAQRIKLASELSRRSTGKTLYILDEPTTGLHFEDIKRLLHILSQLVEKGNTVLIIEHNVDVIKTADWVIDLGPEGGEKGGYIVGEGTPEDIANIKHSWTGKYLKEAMNLNPTK